MIFIGEIEKEYTNNFDQIWRIVHSPELDKLPLKNNELWVPALGPGDKLFSSFRKVFREKRFTENWFKQYYLHEFIDDVTNSNAVDLLKQLVILSHEKRILLSCFCKDEAVSLCHRSIIIGILKGMGADVSPDNYCESWDVYYYLFIEAIRRKNPLLLCSKCCEGEKHPDMGMNNLSHRRNL